MFKMTRDWLFRLYGSCGSGQEVEAERWLLRFGKNVPPDAIKEWRWWKHLIEYQPNTEDIVPRALERIDTEFESELMAHRFLNYMRVPWHADGYMEALEKYKPVTILELGVGGDSAISTAIFLSYLEKVQAENDDADVRLYSVDINRLGTTWLRYGAVPFWSFEQNDSIAVLDRMVADETKWDMIFLDTLPYYGHTLRELNRASLLTKYILCDDVTAEAIHFDDEGGKKRAVKEWLASNEDWTLEMHESKNAVGTVRKKKYRRTVDNEKGSNRSGARSRSEMASSDNSLSEEDAELNGI